MTFEERCERFKRKTEQEQNIFRKIYRTIFLNKKIEIHEKDENMFKLNDTIYKRPKDHCKAKQIINKEQ
jgi:hypothetical protein